jgi:16S rRNA (cytosine1402-N4)-methyltransferase
MKNKQLQPDHISILVDEMLEFFQRSKLSVFFDGTLGAGGHAKAILEAHPEIHRFIGCDKDPEALEIAAKVLSPWKNKVELIQGSFANLDQYLNERNIQCVDGFFLT